MTRKDWEFYPDPSCAEAWRMRETGVSYWNRTLYLLSYAFSGKRNLSAAYIPMAWIGVWLGERALGKE